MERKITAVSPDAYFQIGSPTLQAAMETYRARSKLRSSAHREGVRA